MNTSGSAKPVIGLVGGIGAGKSTVAAELGRLGCAVIDADAIGHDVLDEPSVRQRVRERWGDGVFAPDGAVDRRRLGKEVFADRGQLAELTAITHPLISRRIVERIAAAGDDPAAAAVVLDAAVLLEAGLEGLCTHLVYVDADDETRFKRVADGRGWDRAAWLAREKAQISLDKKRERCQYYVDNSSSVSHLGKHVRGIFREIIRAAERS